MWAFAQLSGKPGEMHPLHWSQTQSCAVIAAIKFICSEAESRPLTELQTGFLEGLRDHVFRHPEIDLAAVESMPPDRFVCVMTDPEHRERALEYLTLAPYVLPDIRAEQADLVAGFFAAAGAHSDSLRFMNHIALHHILLGQLCIARKLLPLLLPGGPVRHLRRALRMIRESRGDPAIAASYQVLERLPSGTLGNAFFRFHRNRGFALPGEPGCIPEELSSLHDLTHILSGYNTDPKGEILSQAFAGGAMEKNGVMVAVIGLLGFHNAILFDVGGHLWLQKGNLEPHEFMIAWTRGQRSISLMSGWDYKSDWALPVGAVREKFRIADAEDIWDGP